MECSSHTFIYSLQECDSTKMKNMSMVFHVLSFQGSVSVALCLQSIKDYSVLKLCPESSL